MAMDDELLILSVFTKGWLSFIFLVLAIIALIYFMVQEDKCDANSVYLKEHNMCISKDALQKPK